MNAFWRVRLEQVIPHMQENSKRELVWYGITIGQIGLGVLVSVKRRANAYSDPSYLEREGTAINPYKGHPN